MKRWANACRREVQALLVERGAGLFAETRAKGGQSRQALAPVRFTDEGIARLPEEEAKGLQAAVVAVCARHEAKHPGYAFRIAPVLTVSVGKMESAWEVSVTPAPAREEFTSRDQVEEVWCAVKHGVALEGHLAEMMSNAAARGEERTALTYARQLGQVVKLRRGWQASALGQRSAEQGCGCGKCREDMQ